MRVISGLCARIFVLSSWFYSISWSGVASRQRGTSREGKGPGSGPFVVTNTESEDHLETGRLAERGGAKSCSPAHHSALAPENFTTLPHFSVSSAMSLPKSAGVPASTAAPRSANRALSLGSARPALTALLSVSTISGGRARGRADAVPGTRLVARYEFADGGQVRQRRRACRGGHRQRAQPAGADVLERPGHRRRTSPGPVR